MSDRPTVSMVASGTEYDPNSEHAVKLRSEGLCGYCGHERHNRKAGCEVCGPEGNCPVIFEIDDPEQIEKLHERLSMPDLSPTAREALEKAAADQGIEPDIEGSPWRVGEAFGEMLEAGFRAGMDFQRSEARRAFGEWDGPEEAIHLFHRERERNAELEADAVSAERELAGRATLSNISPPKGSQSGRARGQPPASCARGPWPCSTSMAGSDERAISCCPRSTREGAR